MALGYRSRVSVARPHPQRHITSDATEEIKFDGYRAEAVKTDGRVNLFSRKRKSFDHHYPLIVEALGELPEGTVVDGEIVALDDSGKPDFNLLQNFRSEAQHIHYFIFDLPIFQDRDLTKLPLSKRREWMMIGRSPSLGVLNSFIVFPRGARSSAVRAADS